MTPERESEIRIQLGALSDRMADLRAEYESLTPEIPPEIRQRLQQLADEYDTAFRERKELSDYLDLQLYGS